MPTLNTVIDAFLASREFDLATVSRVGYWADTFGDKEIAEITPDDVDAAVVALATRGKLRPVRNGEPEPLGKPLAGSTVNRYIGQLASLFRYAKRMRLLPRTFVAPTVGIEKSPEQPDPDRYLRAEEVDRLIRVARVADRRWGKMPALITLAFHSGLRVGNLLDVRWGDVDLDQRTVAVGRTKNGRPIVAPLTERAAEELDRLPGNRHPEDRVFANRHGGRYHFRRLWARVCREAGLPGRNFHQMRHGCGHAMATAGVGQATIMAVMGHRTLSASARYMHADVRDKRRAIDAVFDHA
ncbi:MAG: site-specific integrase [Gammaproteobacteria bacterium]